MMLKKMLAVLLAVMLLIGSTAIAEQAEVEDFAMAYVNGEAVMFSMVRDYAEYINEYSDMGDVESDDAMLEYYEQALDAAIGYVLMSQKAEEMGLKAMTEEEIAQMEADAAAEWAEYVETYAVYFGYSDEESEENNAAARLNAMSYLESYGVTEESLREDALNNAWYEKLSAEMTKDVNVTEEEIRAAFDAEVENFRVNCGDDAGYYEFMVYYYGMPSYYVPAGYRGVKQILLEVDAELLENYLNLEGALAEQDAVAEETAAADGAVTADMVDAARAAVLASVQDTVDTIYARLAAGETFDALIDEYNTDPGMQSEPYNTLGYEVHPESIIYDAAFVEAAFSVNNIGEVSAPYVGAYGVYMVQYLRDVPAGAVEFTDDIRNEFYEMTVANLQNEAINAAVSAWMAEADIIVTVEAEAYLPHAEATITDAEEMKDLGEEETVVAE